MRKFFLITTSCAALSALTAMGASQAALAQAEQQKHETSGSERPAVKASTETQKRETAAKPDAMSDEKRAAQDKTEQRDKSAQDKTEQRDKAAMDKTETRDKAAQEKTEQHDKAAQDKTETRDKAAQERTEQRDKTKTGEAQEKNDSTRTTEASSRGRELDERQVSDFRQRLQKDGRVTETNINFDVRIGVNVPESVTLAVLPTDIVAEYPQFSGYDYVMAQDQIIIVDPQSRAVVQVVGGPPTMRAAAVNPCSTTQ
jgi:hypothetical protein